MYRFAYSAICDELPAPARLPSPRQALTDAIELIGAADKARPASCEQLQLLSDFRRLWLVIVDGLMRAEALPPESLADVLAAANGVLQEIERWRFGKACLPRDSANGTASELLL